MDVSKIITGAVNGSRYTTTAPIVKEDYGMYLKIVGIELPDVYEVDFSNSEDSGTSVTMIGNADGVLIPRQFISSGKDIFAYLYHVGDGFGRTVYKFKIPNKVRPDRTAEEPTPEEQSIIDQAINTLNNAVSQVEADASKAEAAVSHYPKIQSNTWRVWNVDKERWDNTAIVAAGQNGQDAISVFMLTGPYIIPTDSNGVLTSNITLKARFKAMRGNTPLEMTLKNAQGVELSDPNNPYSIQVAEWSWASADTDIEISLILPGGYKIRVGDSGEFRFTITVGGIDYLLGASWAIIKSAV